MYTKNLRFTSQFQTFILMLYLMSNHLTIPILVITGWFLGYRVWCYQPKIFYVFVQSSWKIRVQFINQLQEINFIKISTGMSNLSSFQSPFVNGKQTWLPFLIDSTQYEVMSKDFCRLPKSSHKISNNLVFLARVISTWWDPST